MNIDQTRMDPMESSRLRGTGVLRKG